jgi:peptidoglycan glycosyltransferase
VTGINRQIRILGAGMIILFLILFLQLNNLQLIQANKLDHNHLNTRGTIAEFNLARGDILTSDGTVIAQSQTTPDDTFKFLRNYPQGPLFAGLTGYFSYTYGDSGAEQEFDDYLTGKKSKFEFPKNLRSFLLDRQANTENVTLTVTEKLQQVAEQQLAGRDGAVVAINPSTGAILAMYSNPTFDPNPLAAHDQQSVHQAWQSLIATSGSPLAPASYDQSFFPGSTFKIIDSAAVFDHRPSLATKVFPSVAGLTLPDTAGLQLHNFGGESCGGNLLELFTVSCDTGFAQVGLDLGPGPLASEARSFGFDQSPPLDLPGVARSYFPPAASFNENLAALAKSAIGQESVSASPLEIALMASAIADHGVIMAPHILEEVTNVQGQVVSTYKPHPWITATSAATASQLTNMMISVVQRGTADGVQIPGIQMAAKTGTAETGRNTIHAWFAAFAPATNPKIAVAVLVENQPPGNAYTGAAIAGPIAKAVIEAALTTS